MESLAVLESQLMRLATLSKSNSKLADNFTETSASIEMRTKRIQDDVQPWKTAQENITTTIEEMSKAARSYRMPPFVNEVLNKREKDPITVCKCIDQLVYANEYLASKPSNDVGERLQEKAAASLQTVAKIADDLIRSAFLHATSKWFGFGAPGANDFRTPRKRPTTTAPFAAADGHQKGVSGAASLVAAAGIIRNRDALRNIDQLIQKVYQTFDSKEVVHVEVPQMLDGCVEAALQSMLDAAYFEENEGVRDPSSTHINLAAVTKHYQRGDHRLLKISEACRTMVLDVSSVLDEYVIRPLDEDSDVMMAPSEIATRVFDSVLQRAHAACAFDLTANGDATRMFVASRGAGIGLCPAGTNNGRYFRDSLFIGLDLVAELWGWKDCAEKVAGDHHDFIDHVDESLVEFLEKACEPLEIYAEEKGTIDADLLLELSLEMNSAEWAPAYDCTAHESTTNVLYLLKVIFSDYMGATKLAYQGGHLLSADDDYDALEKVEYFVRRCIEGTLDDLRTIARAALRMQKDEYKHASLKGLIDSVKVGVRNVLQRKAAASGDGSSKVTAHVDEHVFLINNISYLLEHFTKDACFTGNVFPVRPGDADADEHPLHPWDASGGDSEGSSQGKATKKKSDKQQAPVGIPVVREVIEILERERDDAVDAFRASWAACFPPLAEDDRIGSLLDDEDSALTKEQRMAVKKWYASVGSQLSARIQEGRVHVVMDPRLRDALIEGACEMVQEKFGEMEDLLRGRDWSKRPMHWMIHETDEWVKELEKMF